MSKGVIVNSPKNIMLLINNIRTHVFLKTNGTIYPKDTLLLFLLNIYKTNYLKSLLKKNVYLYSHVNIY